MVDLVSRQKVLRCIKESRENIDWGQSEDGDAFLRYSAALYLAIASKECLPPAQPEPLQEDLHEHLHREKEQAYMKGYEDGRMLMLRALNKKGEQNE